jgi:hypothetical protein
MKDNDEGKTAVKAVFRLLLPGKRIGSCGVRGYCGRSRICNNAVFSVRIRAVGGFGVTGSDGNYKKCDYREKREFCFHRFKISLYAWNPSG